MKCNPTGTTASQDEQADTGAKLPELAAANPQVAASAGDDPKPQYRQPSTSVSQAEQSASGADPPAVKHVDPAGKSDMADTLNGILGLPDGEQTKTGTSDVSEVGLHPGDHSCLFT